MKLNLASLSDESLYGLLCFALEKEMPVNIDVDDFISECQRRGWVNEDETLNHDKLDSVYDLIGDQ